MCRKFLTDDPDRRVVMLTVYDDERYLYGAMRMGARGYLLKRINGDELVRQLQLVFEVLALIVSALFNSARGG